MADLKRTVDLVFRGVDETGQATRAALDNAAKFSQSIGNVTGPIADFTKGAVQIEAGLLAAGAAITAFSIKAAGDFDAGFREIATLIDEPIDALDDFRQAILDYAATSSQSLEGINTAVYSAISAGVDYTDALGTVATAEKLAVASKADLGDTLNVLVSSLNAYGEGTEEAERFSDALFTTVRQGQTTLPELAQSLSQVTSIAAAGGVDFEELLAAVATLTASGLPTSEAITSIRGAISNIIKPTSEAARLAADLGIEFNASALESKGLAGVLADVAEATGGNVDQQAKLFGSVQGLTAVLSLGGTSADSFASNIAAMGASSGATEEAFGKMAESIDLSNQRIKNSLDTLFISIGTPLLDEWGGVASGIAAIFNSIGAEIQDGEFSRIVEVIEEILADVAGALSTAADLFPDLDLAPATDAIIQGITAVRDSIASLFESFDLTSTDGIERLIQTIASSFAALSEFTGAVIEQLGRVIAFLADGGIDKVAEFAREWGATAGKLAAFVVVVNTLLPAATLLFTGLSKLVGVLAGAKGIGLAGSAIAASSSLLPLAAKLGPAGAVAGAVGYFTFQVAKLTNALIEWKRASDRQAEAEDALARATNTRADSIARIQQETGVLLDTNRELVGQLEEQGFTLDQTTGKWVRVQEEARNYDAEVRAAMEEAGLATEAQRDQLSFLQQSLIDAGLTAEQLGLAKPLQDAADATEQVADSTRQWVETIVDGVRTFTQSTGDATRKQSELVATLEDGTLVYQRITDEVEEVDRALEDVTQTSEEFRLKVLEIASQEYIATIEAKTELDIAQLEAETARVEAAFESINTTIQSTGEVIGDALGVLFGDDLSGLDKWFVQDLIKAEEARRDEALRLQTELTEAQIDLLRERTRQMANGDAMLTVDGAGLQPHLEAFMWEILRTIQVRVNQDGLDMLLGVPA